MRKPKIKKNWLFFIVILIYYFKRIIKKKRKNKIKEIIYIY